MAQPEKLSNQGKPIAPQEMRQLPPPFIELMLTGEEPAWCVDGRPDPSKPKGPQMLGGSFQPILLSAIVKDRNFDQQAVEEGLSTLEKAGYTTGAHEGSHKNAHLGKSDCGFADMMPIVFQTALDRKAEITTRLQAVYEANKDKIGELSKPFDELIADAYAQLEGYAPERILLIVTKLVDTTAQTGATIECVQGDHAEEIAFVNLQKNVTLDSLRLNQAGRQAFNLDLWAVIEQAATLGVDAPFALAAGLIMYLATEIVLVEMKGKPALPIAIH